jgi:hypothetical protein
MFTVSAKYDGAGYLFFIVDTTILQFYGYKSCIAAF